ncbi:transcriptional regulator [Chryseobacterium sp.]|uniref:transcriptional regulator n=1 Tax=Chryseobacterium sp. TaxID=1871047 RepID=UPI000ED58250|nr:transcriptional regulator [Chryseobacterium sp.]HCA09390.1 transcriptional regulator [Chryseobacterium sp.]
MIEEKDLIKVICHYIYSKWIVNAQSQRDFASIHEIEESTVRRIKNIALGTAKEDYNMSLKTLSKICKKQEISLEEFFKLIKQ